MLVKKKTKAALSLALTAILALYMPMASFAEGSFDESVNIKNCEEVKKAASPSEVELEDTAEDGMIVTLKANADSFDCFDGLWLDVSVVNEEEAREADKELKVRTKTDNIAKRVTYDIRVMHDDKEIQPVDGKKVQVEFTMAEIPSGADAVSVYHHNEVTDKIETIVDDVPVNEDKKDTDTETTSDDIITISKGSVSKKVENKIEIDEDDIIEDGDILDDVTVMGETSSFSLYTVDFTYDEKTVSIAGDTDHNKLSDILAGINITEEIEGAKAFLDAACSVPAADGVVTDAEGSALFKVYKEDGTWFVDAINAFQTSHGLIINTTDGAQYQIKVTDAAGIDVGNCLTFTALTDGSSVTFNWASGSNVMYSFNGSDWSDYTSNTQIDLNEDQTVSFKGNNVNTNDKHHFSMTGSIAASGDVTSLTNESGGDTELTDEMCYMYMFYGCSSLTAAPSLPSTDLARGCYENMFEGCTNLITAPALPATTLQNACYMSMFMGCSSLTKAPALPATTLAESCYGSMFHSCTNLTTAPVLPTTSLANCYNCMFQLCKKLLIGEKGTHDPYVGKEIFTCPKTQIQSETVKNMFLDTGGAFKDSTPHENKTYYTYTSEVALDKNSEDATAGTVTTVYATNEMTMPALTEGQLPTNGSYVFVGYFDATVSGTKYYNADGTSANNWDKTDASSTLYAHWATDINAASVTVASISNQTYSSSEKTPDVVVKDAGNTLTKDIHYTVSYSNNTNAGIATVSITGIGQYTGQRNEEFVISPAPIMVSGTTVAPSREYDGETTAEAVMGTADGIVAGDDVVVSIESANYADKNVGTGKTVNVVYKITGDDCGNYVRPEDLETSADITPKNVIVGAHDKSSYVGSDLVPLTYTADALYGTDTYSGNLLTGADKNRVGIYDITQGTLTAGGNYTISFIPASYTVKSKQTNKTSSGGGAWTSAPAIIGSATNPISNGVWKLVNGSYQYVVNGEPLKYTLAWISYVPSGQTTPVIGCFYFDKNGIMATGWRLIDGKWYFFDTAAGATGGMMLINTTTPDGYQVGADGAWL